MKKVYVFILSFIGIWVSTASYGQPNIVPVSPEAAALAKMVNYPVNYNTGIPNINIPFYEIKVGGLTLPITLNYHGGGFKINERATRAGLGWSLSSDLQITRSVNGLDDFTPLTGYIANSLVRTHYNDVVCPGCDYPIWSSSPYPYKNAYDLAMGIKDGMPDKFNYKLLNKSGSFYFQKNHAGTGYTIVPVPFNNLQISYNNGQFKIIDMDGTTYYFGMPGAINMNQQALSGKEVSGQIDINGGCTDCVVTAWKCMKIENNTKTDEITFTYQTRSELNYRSYQDKIEYYSNSNPCGLFEYFTSDDYPMNSYSTYEQLMLNIPFYRISTPKYMSVYGGSGYSYFHVPYFTDPFNAYDVQYSKVNTGGEGVSSYDVAGLSLEEINFRGGRIEFIGADKLSYIRVLDSKSAEVKSVQFFSSYTDTFYDTDHYNGPNFQGTLYLDSLHMKNNATVFERYAMAYNEKFCFGNHLKGHDAWGYCNEITEGIPDMGGGFMSIPRTKLTEDRYYEDINNGCVNFITDVRLSIGENTWAEAVNGDYARRGILKRIVYPTGGYVDFDFESNQYLQRFAKEGGVEPLSIPQVSGGLRIRSITYYERNHTYPESQTYYRYGDLEEGTGVLLNQPPLSPRPYEYHFNSVSYPQKILYLEGPSTPCFNRGCLNAVTVEDKTTYHAASYLDYTYASGAPIYYTKVTQYQQDLGVQTGKTVYEYYPPETYYPPLVAPLGETRVENTNIRYLKADAFMGAQKAISDFEYVQHEGYHLLHRKSFEYETRLRNGMVKVAYAFPRIIYQVVSGNFSGSHRDLYDNTYSFGGAPYLGNEYVMGQYGIPVGGLVMTEETDEWFDSLDVRSVHKVYTYNASYWQPSQILIDDSEANTIVRYLKYSYDLNGIYDQMQSLNMVSQVIEERETFVNIDMDVVAERFHKRTDYGSISVGSGFIAPISVESSVKGESLETDMSFNEYDQYANLLQYTGRDDIPVSYLWGYEGLYPVAELKGVDYDNIPSSFKSHAQIINPTSDASLRTVLSSLRSNFTGDELISTFTYKRLVGVTSKTAPNKYTNYYEYDPYGRLTAEKNHQQKLVNVYNYYMPGPLAIDVDYPNYTNIPMMRTYSFPCDLTPTDLYRVFNYIVPGGKYDDLSTESANQSAEYELEDTPNLPELPPCPVVGNTATFELFGTYYTVNNYPAKVEIDFIQNGSVVATQIAPFNSASGGGSPLVKSSFHLPEGEYQLSFRPSADTRYTEAYLNYTFTATDEGYYHFVQTGDTVTINKNKQYEISITNVM